MLKMPLRTTYDDGLPDRLDPASGVFLRDLLDNHSKGSFFYPDAALHNRHILNMGSLNHLQIEHVLQQAEVYRARLNAGERLHIMDGQLLATLFYEPSTRTRLSFEAAMHRLGGQVISTPDGYGSSSAVKGESIADSIRTVCGYADVIAQRHPAIGSAQAAADAADDYGVPILNAGDGAGEHPTQALLDLFTIRDERGKLDGLRVVLAGDLKHGRTVHSLLRALCLWRVHVTLVSPVPELAIPPELLSELRTELHGELRSGSATCEYIHETDDLYAATENADVLYMTRLQKERFTSAEQHQALGGQFVVDQALMDARPNMTLMHPLPRVDEITPAVDKHPNAAYFRQARNGLYVRMALLALVKGRAV